VLLHDNARPHIAGLITNLLTNFRWEVFNHPPYSPDLAPSDYHAFPNLKGALGGKRFHTTRELEDAVSSYFHNLDAEWYARGIENLVSRYDKCLQRNGDYVEK
jgi:transposase